MLKSFVPAQMQPALPVEVRVVKSSICVFLLQLLLSGFVKATCLMTGINTSVSVQIILWFVDACVTLFIVIHSCGDCVPSPWILCFTLCLRKRM